MSFHKNRVSLQVQVTKLKNTCEQLAGPVKWISKWWGYERLESIVDDQRWATRKIIEF